CTGWHSGCWSLGGSAHRNLDRPAGTPRARVSLGYMIEPYYFALGDGRFESTIHAQGAWNAHEQHMAPVSGILPHSIELFAPRPELRVARISYDILGLIPDGEFEIVTTMLRPGRTIEL